MPRKPKRSRCGLPANDFKRSQGLPLHAFLLNSRINRAKRMLLHTKRTVAAIGQELRFYSTQHFAKTFRRIIGVNPHEYRMTRRNANGPKEASG